MTLSIDSVMPFLGLHCGTAYNIKKKIKIFHIKRLYVHVPHVHQGVGTCNYGTGT